MLCEKCEEFAADAYFDHLGHTVIIYKKCNADLDYGDCGEYKYEERKRATNRKHNLEETNWGKDMEIEINALRSAGNKIMQEAQRLEDILEGDSKENMT